MTECTQPVYAYYVELNGTKVYKIKVVSYDDQGFACVLNSEGYLMKASTRPGYLAVYHDHDLIALSLGDKIDTMQPNWQESLISKTYSLK